MENRSLPIGFIIKQVNNVYEKDLNERLKKIGITSSQCAVLDYLFHTSKDEVSQRDVEKNLNLKNPTVTGILKRLDEKPCGNNAFFTIIIGIFMINSISVIQFFYFINETIEMKINLFFQMII